MYISTGVYVLRLEAFELLLLLRNGRVQIQVRAVVAVFVQLQRRIVQLRNHRNKENKLQKSWTRKNALISSNRVLICPVITVKTAEEGALGEVLRGYLGGREEVECCDGTPTVHKKKKQYQQPAQRS